MTQKAKRHGLVLLNTGDGKGKTTASLGVAFRALGWGWKILIVQFFKGQWKTGEERVIQEYALPIDYKAFGGGCTWEETDSEDINDKCHKAWSFTKDHILNADYDLIIADEINNAMAYGFIDTEDVINTLQQRKKWIHVILTGRNAPEKVKKYADLVSVIDAYKHPFEKGIFAQKGVEF